MSVPKYLYSTEGGALEPLLAVQPANGKPVREMSVSRKSDANDDDFSDIQPAVYSFASEPFHRFGNMGFQHTKRATVQVPDGGAGNGSEERFTGGVDANSDPEVAAFAHNGRTTGLQPVAAGLGREGYVNAHPSHSSITGSAAVNSGERLADFILSATCSH